MVRALAVLSATLVGLSTLTVSACGSATLASRWDGDDESALSEQFSRCGRYEEDGAVALDCGLYVFRAWTVEAKRSHEAEIDLQVKRSLDEPFTGVLKQLEHLGPVDVEGLPVELSTATYVPEPDTIVQPSVEVYASQLVDGERQVFRCFHTLAMVTDAEDVVERVAPCFTGVKALAVASR